MILKWIGRRYGGDTCTEINLDWQAVVLKVRKLLIS
jgi:hypothetical protein